MCLTMTQNSWTDVGRLPGLAHTTAERKRSPQERQRERARSLERVGLALVYAVSALSLLGFAAFGLHPERLAAAPGAAAFYGWMMLAAPRAQILFAFAALALFLTQHTGARWLPA